MNSKNLDKIEEQLMTLEASFDICVEQSDDPIRLGENFVKLREIIRKNAEWRKEVITLLKNIN